MADVVDKDTRSRMMSGIKGKNTKPEILIRKGLFSRGFRYRLHDAKLPGKPDLVLPKFKAIILVNGCFWHKHDCHLFKWPSTRMEFWREKMLSNVERDFSNFRRYKALGYKVMVVWECALKGNDRLENNEVLDSIEEWLKNCEVDAQIEGKLK